MKTVYVSFLFHANMCYDRYTKQEIRSKFPRIYAGSVRKLHQHPQVTAHIDLPGLTLLSLKHHAPWLLDEIRPLVARGQVIMAGCQYAASHALCADEESDLLGGRLSLELLRREFGEGVDAFFPQEIVWHPQMPFEMSEMGVRKLIVMPTGWSHPRRIVGLDGSEVTVFPLDLGAVRLNTLEWYYDNHPDGSFVMTGGDMEAIGDLDAWVREIERLGAAGKRIEWTTVDRYEREVGIQGSHPAPGPFGQAQEDREHSPSFSRWVGDPEDMIWHGYAVEALEALRAAGFCGAAARLHGLGTVDPPLDRAQTTPPDNAWDAFFEHTAEYPETEDLLAPAGPTVLSHAWHQALIGLNSDASGWFPWQPRTRHRNLCLQTARRYAEEVMRRFTGALAPQLSAPADALESVLVLNPMPARTVEVAIPTLEPRRVFEASGQALAGASVLEDGRWQAGARVDLPAYGYRLLGLRPAEEAEVARWEAGSAVQWGAEASGSPEAEVLMEDGRLLLRDRGREVGISVEPFRLSDPSGAWPPEEVTPDWNGAATRVRRGALSHDLEVFTELAWAVWLRLVLALRDGYTEVRADVHVDMPRRIGKLGYQPEGLLLRFQGGPGEVVYDIPYGVIAHGRPEASFIAVQRFAMVEAPGPAAHAGLGVIALGGNQSMRVSGAEGSISLNLGASTQGRPDTRPECEVGEPGHSQHRITSGGDPFTGTYHHRCAVAFGSRAELALTARRLRTPAPLFAVCPGGGTRPDAASLLQVEPDTAHVTAFRLRADGIEVVVNDLGGEDGRACCEGRAARIGPYGVHTFRLPKPLEG